MESGGVVIVEFDDSFFAFLHGTINAATLCWSRCFTDLESPLLQRLLEVLRSGAKDHPVGSKPLPGEPDGDIRKCSLAKEVGGVEVTLYGKRGSVLQSG